MDSAYSLLLCLRSGSSPVQNCGISQVRTFSWWGWSCDTFCSLLLLPICEIPECSVRFFFNLEGILRSCMLHKDKEKLQVNTVTFRFSFFRWMWVECSLDWINKLIWNSFREYFPKHFFSVRKLKHALCPVLFNFENPSTYPQNPPVPTSRQEFQSAAFEANASFSPCFCSLMSGTYSKPLQVTETIFTGVRGFGSGWWRKDREGLLEFLLL